MQTRWQSLRTALLWITFTLLVSACSDTINDPIEPSAEPAPADSAPPDTPGLNAFEVNLHGDLALNGAETGSGTFSASVDADSGVISGTLVLEDFAATGAELRQGFVGEAGELIVALVADGVADGTDFSLPEDTVLTLDQIDLIETGGLHILVVNQDATEVLRGQLALNNALIFFTELTASQQIPPTTPTTDESADATLATAGLTVDPLTGDLIARVSPIDAADPLADVTLELGLAGIDNDAVIVTLAPAVDDVDLFIEPPGASLAEDALSALMNAQLYVETTLAGGSSGARGQVLPVGVELTITPLEGAQVVPPVVTQTSGTVALTAFENNARVSILVNLLGLDDASAVNLSQAPLGQNGAVLFALEQNPNDISQWSLIDQTLTATQSNLLATQQLFISASSGEFPNGELRGQLVTDSSVQPPAPDILQVIDIMPAAGEVLDALPGSLVATFNLAVDPQSIGADSVQFSASGGDGSFGEANDLMITPTAIDLVDQTLTIDLAGISLDPDVFQLVLNGNGIAPITSAQGSVLDGDADNVAGGDFISSFTVAEPPAVAPSFTEVQEIFTANCLPCHSSLALSGGLGLQAPQTFDNIVGVVSSQVPELFRIDPNDPEASYIIDKLEGTQTVGGQMPLGQSPLPQSTIQLIRDWISAGAVNN